MGLLPLLSGRLSRSLCPRIKVTVSKDKYNVPLLNLSDSAPVSVFRYITPCYTHSILPTNYIFSATFAFTSALTPYTFYTPSCNPTPSSAAIAANLPTLE